MISELSGRGNIEMQAKSLGIDLGRDDAQRVMSQIKKLEHERRVPRWWVLGASISLVTMTSGVFVPISELGQVLNASLALIVGSLVINIVLYIAEQVVVDSLRKKRVDRYASKLADPQF